MTERLPREERAALMRAGRRAAIMAAALELAEEIGFSNIGRDSVAARAGVAAGSVNHEFGTVASLRDAVMAEAIARGNLPIIAQGLACNHAAVQSAPPELRVAALTAVAA